MGRVVLDSSVVIALLEPTDPHHLAASKMIEKYQAHEFYISAISLTESLMHPFAKGKGLKIAEQILAVVHQVKPVDSNIAIDAARIRAEKDLGIGDALIAATAASIDAELWTTDRRLGKSVKGARLLI